MKRKLWITAVILAFLGMTTAFSPPAVGQVGLGRPASVTITGQLILPDGDFSDPALYFGSSTVTYGWSTDVVSTRLSLSSAGNEIAAYTSAGLHLSSNGTAAAPNYTSRSDANTGMFHSGGDALGFTVGGAVVLDLEETNVAGAGTTLTTISSTLGIMDNSDTVIGLSIELSNADHTGSSNTVDAISIAGMTGDAQAQENLFHLGDGFDFVFDLAEALGTHTATTNSDKDANTASGTLKIEVNGTLYHIQLYADS